MPCQPDAATAMTLRLEECALEFQHVSSLFFLHEMHSTGLHMLTASSASSKAGGMYVSFPVEGKRPHTAEQCVGLRGGSDARSGSSTTLRTCPSPCPARCQAWTSAAAAWHSSRPQRPGQTCPTGRQVLSNAMWCGAWGSSGRTPRYVLQSTGSERRCLRGRRGCCVLRRGGAHPRKYQQTHSSGRVRATANARSAHATRT